MKVPEIFAKNSIKNWEGVNDVYGLTYVKNKGKSAYGKSYLNYTITIVFDNRISSDKVYWYVFDFVNNTWLTHNEFVSMFDMADMPKVSSVIEDLLSNGVEVFYDDYKEFTSD